MEQALLLRGHVMTDKSVRRQSGFSMVELLVVVFVIVLAAAISIPNIAGFLRNYQIRGAAQQVAGEIQAARLKAITKNVNLGVAFVVLSPTDYQYVIEDDLVPAPLDTARLTVGTRLGQAVQVGPRRRLPQGIQFGTTCSTNPVFAPTDPGLRFDRLGASCDPGGAAEPCPALVVAPVGDGTARVMNTASSVSAGGITYEPGGVVCVTRPGTALTRIVSVTTGGRVVVQR